MEVEAASKIAVEERVEEIAVEVVRRRVVEEEVEAFEEAADEANAPPIFATSPK